MNDKKNIDKFPDTFNSYMYGLDIELWKAVLRRYKEVIKGYHTSDKTWNPKISDIIFDLFRHMEYSHARYNVADEMFKQLCIDHKDLKEYHAWDSDGAHYTKKKYEMDDPKNEDEFYKSDYHCYKIHRIWHIYEQEEKSIEYLENKIKSKEIQHKNAKW